MASNLFAGGLTRLPGWRKLPAFRAEKHIDQMKHIATILLAGALAATSLAAPDVRKAPAAGDRTLPLQLSLVSPLSLVDETDSVNGLRLTLIFCENRNVSGLDFGLANRATGAQRGFQLGGVNVVEGDLAGLQGGAVNWVGGKANAWEFGLINIVKGEVAGGQFGFLDVAVASVNCQFGLANYAGRMDGLQVGCINVAESVSGMQFGIVNYTGQFMGLQVGILNIATGKAGMWKVLPVVNANW